MRAFAEELRARGGVRALQMGLCAREGVHVYAESVRAYAEDLRARKGVRAYADGLRARGEVRAYADGLRCRFRLGCQEEPRVTGFQEPACWSGCLSRSLRRWGPRVTRFSCLFFFIYKINENVPRPPFGHETPCKHPKQLSPPG